MMSKEVQSGGENSGARCSQCGTRIAHGTLEGLCPACLLKQGVAAETEPGMPSFQAPSLEEIGRLFPKLEILAFLGRGGMGAVYKARQPALDRIVALKILPAAALGNRGPDFSERFNREARALAKLSHPNIVAVHEFGQVEDQPYFIMEYVDGLNLRQLEHARKLTPHEALQIVPQICDALQFAHDAGVVHRDIKPENILLDKKGTVKIADFGIAKIIGKSEGPVPLAETQGTLGTPNYMAPEQIEKPETVDHRADIFSLGVVLYEMLTGELPREKITAPSRRVEIDVRLDEIVLRALEQAPSLRYQQASEVKLAVNTVNENKPVEVKSVTHRWNSGVDFKTKRTIFGLPLLHVASGSDPATGRARVARGFIAIGGMAQGVIAIGGVAMGVLPFGGVSIGLLAYGGCAFGLCAFGGLAVALLFAFGGLGIAPIALGGSAIGFFAHGAMAYGIHPLGSNAFDEAARNFFEPWGATVLSMSNTVNIVFLSVVLPIGIGVPLCVQAWSRRGHHSVDSKELIRTLLTHATIISLLLFGIRPLLMLINTLHDLARGFGGRLSPATSAAINLATAAHDRWFVAFAILLGLDTVGYILAEFAGGKRARRIWSKIVGIIVFVGMACAGWSIFQLWLGIGETAARTPQPGSAGAHPVDPRKSRAANSHIFAIHGTINGLDSGQPIAGARVWVRYVGEIGQHEAHETSTDGDGHFFSVMSQRSDLFISATAPGYATNVLKVHIGENRESVVKVDLVLQPAIQK